MSHLSPPMMIGTSGEISSGPDWNLKWWRKSWALVGPPLKVNINTTVGHPRLQTSCWQSSDEWRWRGGDIQAPPSHPWWRPPSPPLRYITTLRTSLLLLISNHSQSTKLSAKNPTWSKDVRFLTHSLHNKNNNNRLSSVKSSASRKIINYQPTHWLW